MNKSQLAEKAFLFGFPLIFNLEQVQRFVTTGVGALGAKTFNSFSHAQSLATSDDKFVSVNNDSLYSISQVDLTGGPLLFEIPPVKDRYYIFQLVDAWTENFAYLGKRTLGEEGGKFLLLPPDHTEIPSEFADYHPIYCPSVIITIVGRWASSQENDQELHSLQDSLIISPLNQTLETFQWPTITEIDSDLLFWETLRIYLKIFPVSRSFYSYLQTFEETGILAEESPYIDPSKEFKTALLEGQKNGKNQIQQCLENSEEGQQNGWQMNAHAFDYNADNLGFGTLNQENWLFPHKTRDDLDILCLKRAAAASGGLWGNHGYEAVYLSNYVDENGDKLVGTNKYEVTFSSPPPNDAFWSITMYDVPDYYLVENKINRYSIGDRTENLYYNTDDSLTIYLSSVEPADENQRRNWLPAPMGPFRPILRVYLPKEEILGGEYTFPEIKKVNL